MGATHEELLLISKQQNLGGKKIFKTVFPT